MRAQDIDYQPFESWSRCGTQIKGCDHMWVHPKKEAIYRSYPKNNINILLSKKHINRLIDYNFENHELLAKKKKQVVAS